MAECALLRGQMLVVLLAAVVQNRDEPFNQLGVEALDCWLWLSQRFTVFVYQDGFAGAWDRHFEEAWEAQVVYCRVDEARDD